MSDSPLSHQARKFPSILRKRVPDEYWRVRFLDKTGRLIFKLDPYILHGPNPNDRGLAEIIAMAKETIKKNPFARIAQFHVLHLESRY